MSIRVSSIVLTLVLSLASIVRAGDDSATDGAPSSWRTMVAARDFLGSTPQGLAMKGPPRIGEYRFPGGEESADGATVTWVGLDHDIEIVVGLYGPASKKTVFGTTASAHPALPGSSAGPGTWSVSTGEWSGTVAIVGEDRGHQALLLSKGWLLVLRADKSSAAQFLQAVSGVAGMSPPGLPASDKIVAFTPVAFKPVRPEGFRVSGSPTQPGEEGGSTLVWEMEYESLGSEGEKVGFRIEYNTHVVTSGAIHFRDESAPGWTILPPDRNFTYPPVIASNPWYRVRVGGLGVDLQAWLKQLINANPWLNDGPPVQYFRHSVRSYEQWFRAQELRQFLLQGCPVPPAGWVADPSKLELRQELRGNHGISFGLTWIGPSGKKPYRAVYASITGLEPRAHRNFDYELTEFRRQWSNRVSGTLRSSISPPGSGNAWLGQALNSWGKPYGNMVIALLRIDAAIEARLAAKSNSSNPFRVREAEEFMKAFARGLTTAPVPEIFRRWK